MQILNEWRVARQNGHIPQPDRLPVGNNKKERIQSEYGLILQAARSLNLECNVSYSRKRISSVYITIPPGGFEEEQIRWRFSDHVVPLVGERKLKRTGNVNSWRRKPHIFVNGMRSYDWWKNNLKRMLAGEAPVK